MQKKIAPATVSIHGQEVPVIEYQGQRVVTLAMIDRLHCRPERTARRNFDQNKHRLVEGKDFYRVDNKGLHEFRVSGIFSEAATSGTLITESGYFMLVKSFTDDLAWAVQRELVDLYFRVKRERTARTQSDIPSLSKIRSNFRALVGLHRDYGLDKNIAMLAAEKVMIREFGIEIGRYLELPGKAEGQAHLAIPSPVQERYYNPTEIGARLEPVRSAKTVNKILMQMGFQVNAIIGGDKTWALTTDGEEYGRYYDIGKTRGSGGAPIQQIRWREKVVAVLQTASRDTEVSLLDR